MLKDKSNDIEKLLVKETFLNSFREKPDSPYLPFWKNLYAHVFGYHKVDSKVVSDNINQWEQVVTTLVSDHIGQEGNPSSSNDTAHQDVYDSDDDSTASFEL
tara:strand:+ start:209 stop:514 length:306 start_codon:yes stop_codon:yes gene_type:complete